MKFKPTYIILHHSTTPVGTEFYTFEQVKQSHLNIGYDDVGYHKVIDDAGFVYDGRNESIMGAHCRHNGFNHKALGICLLGNFEINKPKAKQYVKAVIVVADWCEKYNIPTKNILGHNETGANTLCPGKYFDMDKFRQNVRYELENRNYNV